MEIPDSRKSPILQDIIMLITTTGVTFFIVQFVLRQKQIAKLLMEISDFQTYGKPPNIDQLNQKLSVYYRLYDWLLNIMTLSFFLKPIITLKVCKTLNQKRDFQEICGLFLPIWAPFRVNYFPVDQIIHLWEVFGLYFVNKGGSLMSFLMLESMEVLRFKIVHLNLLLVEVIERDGLSLTSRFDKCVCYHQDILR